MVFLIKAPVCSHNILTNICYCELFGIIIISADSATFCYISITMCSSWGHDKIYCLLLIFIKSFRTHAIHMFFMLFFCQPT